MWTQAVHGCSGYRTIPSGPNLFRQAAFPPRQPSARLRPGPGSELQAGLAGAAGALRQQQAKGQPHLVVAPASVLENWQREFACWCPALRVASYFGPGRHELRHNLQVCRCWPSTR